jgi:hypothetical protein
MLAITAACVPLGTAPLLFPFARFRDGIACIDGGMTGEHDF